MSTKHYYDLSIHAEKVGHVKPLRATTRKYSHQHWAWGKETLWDCPRADDWILLPQNDILRCYSQEWKPLVGLRKTKEEVGPRRPVKLTPGPQSPYSLSIPDQLKMPQYMLLQLFRVCVHAASPFKGASPGQSLLLGTCLSLTLDHCPGLMGKGAWLPVLHSSELADTH